MTSNLARALVVLSVIHPVMVLPSVLLHCDNTYASNLAWDFVEDALKLYSEAGDLFLGCTVFSSIRICVDIIGVTHFDRFFKLAETCLFSRLFLLVAQEFARHATRRHLGQWHTLLRKWMSQSMFYQTCTLFSILVGKFGLTNFIVKTLIAQWPKSKHLCFVAFHYDKSLLKIRNLILQNSIFFDNNICSNVNLIKWIDFPEFVSDKEQSDILIKTLSPARQNSSPIFAQGLRTFANRCPDLMKQQFTKFVHFSTEQHYSMNNVLADTLIHIATVCTESEWQRMCAKLSKVQRQYVKKMLCSLSLFGVQKKHFACDLVFAW